MSKLRSIHARRLAWDFSESPKYWARSSAGISHFLNVYTLLVPENEKYYIRTLNACRPMIKDERLLGALVDFCRQESLHGLAHRRHGDRLRDLGVHTDSLVSATNWFLYSILEKLQPLRIRVSIVAAIEHINATWAHAFLSLDLLEGSDAEVKTLFDWHFAEEIEHKAVANEVLASVFPGYATRLFGGLLAFPTFLILLALGTLYLVLRDKDAGVYSSLRDLSRFLFCSGFSSVVGTGIKRYFARRFEPWDVEDSYLAERAISGAIDTHELLATPTSDVGQAR